MFGFAIWDRERQRAVHRARSPRHQADVLRADAARPGLRLGAEVAALPSRRAPRASRPTRSRTTSRSARRPSRSVDPRRCAQAAARLLPPLPRRRASASRATGICATPRPRGRCRRRGRRLRSALALARRRPVAPRWPTFPSAPSSPAASTRASVVGTMAELGARPKTFSIGFEEADFNELDYARIIAKKFGTDHHELIVRPDAWELTEKLVWFLDEPFADVSAIPTFLVSKLAAAQVKVVLSGDGGDEVFAGYDRYGWTVREERRFGWLPRPLRWAMTQAAAALPDRARGKNFLRHVAQPAHLRYVDGQSLFQEPMKERLLGPELRAQLAQRNAAALAATRERVALLDGAPGDLVKRLMYLDTVTYLPLDILTKVDRMTMAHSLEARPPLLDHTLVERVFAMSSSLKLTARRHAEGDLQESRVPIFAAGNPHAREARLRRPHRQVVPRRAQGADAGAARRSALRRARLARREDRASHRRRAPRRPPRSRAPDLEPDDARAVGAAIPRRRATLLESLPTESGKWLDRWRPARRRLPERRRHRAPDVRARRRVNRTRYRPMLATASRRRRAALVAARHRHRAEVFPLRGSLVQANTAFQVARMAMLIREQNVRVVHAHDFYSNVIGVAAASARGRARRSPRAAISRTGSAARSERRCASPAASPTRWWPTPPPSPSRPARARRRRRQDARHPQRHRRRHFDMQAFARPIRSCPPATSPCRACTWSARCTCPTRATPTCSKAAAIFKARGVRAQFILVSDGALRSELEEKSARARPRRRRLLPRPPRRRAERAGALRTSSPTRRGPKASPTPCWRRCAPRAPSSPRASAASPGDARRRARHPRRRRSVPPSSPRRSEKLIATRSPATSWACAAASTSKNEFSLDRMCRGARHSLCDAATSRGPLRRAMPGSAGLTPRPADDASARSSSARCRHLAAASPRTAASWRARSTAAGVRADLVDPRRVGPDGRDGRPRLVARLALAHGCVASSSTSTPTATTAAAGPSPRCAPPATPARRS